MKCMEFMPPSSTSSFEDAQYIIVPVPIGDKTSWVGGADKGPSAVLRASAELEYYDLETGFNISNVRYFTYSPVDSRDKLRELANFFFNRNRSENKIPNSNDSVAKFPIFVGGDHSISIPILSELPSEVSILHLDAHLDMRSSYMGDPESHACALYEASKNHRVVHYGIRSGCEEDLENVRRFGNVIAEDLDEILANLGERVYVTFDVDVYDPSVIPATGTPEPGGISWKDSLDLLSRVFAEKRVVGMDIVELSPKPGLHYAEFTIAKLMFRSIYYHYSSSL